MAFYSPFFLFVGVGFILFGVFDHVMYQCPVVLRRQVADNGPVFFGDFLVVFLKHFIQSGQGFAGTGKQYDTAYRAVDAMGHSQKYVSRFVVFFLM